MRRTQNSRVDPRATSCGVPPRDVPRFPPPWLPASADAGLQHLIWDDQRQNLRHPLARASEKARRRHWIKSARVLRARPVVVVVVSRAPVIFQGAESISRERPTLKSAVEHVSARTYRANLVSHHARAPASHPSRRPSSRPRRDAPSRRSRARRPGDAP